MVVWWLGGGRRGSRWEGGQHGESISHAGQNEAEDQNWTFFRRSERWLKRLQEAYQMRPLFDIAEAENALTN